MSQLPDDVQPIILQYLPFNDVLFSYRPTCKQWLESASQLQILNMNFLGNGTMPIKTTFHSLMALCGRFKNTKEIHTFNNFQLSQMRNLLQQCRHLELIWINKQPTFQPYDTWEETLKAFPKYRAMQLGVKTIPNNVVIENLNITHLLIGPDETISPLDDQLIPHIAKTVTHITILAYTADFRKFVDALPMTSNITMIKDMGYMTADTEKSWKILFQKSPNLKEFFGSNTSTSQIDIIDSCCPNLRTVTLYNLHVIDETKWFRNLKKATIHDTIRIHKDAELEEYDGDLKYMYPNLGKLKKLISIVSKENLPKVIRNCQMLEEVTINALYTNSDIKTLVHGCPKLRYITGAAFEIKIGRMNSGVLDAAEIRSQTRPSKRRKVSNE
jgi:hypothetical protein